MTKTRHYNNKKETNWKKANKNSTNDKESCFKCFFFVKENFPQLLGAVVEFLSSLCGGQFLDT